MPATGHGDCSHSPCLLLLSVCQNYSVPGPSSKLLLLGASLWCRTGVARLHFERVGYSLLLSSITVILWDARVPPRPLFSVLDEEALRRGKQGQGLTVVFHLLSCGCMQAMTRGHQGGSGRVRLVL